MIKLLRFFFYGIVVRVAALILLGLNVRHRERLPARGPAILAANHNSHLDTLVLITLLPLRLLPHIHPAAAMDYFLRNRVLAWFALNIVGIVPVARKPDKRTPNPLAECEAALARGDILVFFPEGTRGEAERRSQMKSGIAHLVQRHPDIPVIPVYLHGLGKALPKGEALLTPFICDAFVGEAIYWNGARDEYMRRLNDAMDGLEQEGEFAEWD
jgi:1-acyl-sn-glycerol-3-phosphate acyltransferase